MSLEDQDDLRACAIEWHIRLRNGDDATWEAFAAWLAEDRRHADAYEAVEAADHAIEPLLPQLVIRESANDSDAIGFVGEDRPRGGSRKWQAGGALAAALLLGLWLFPRGDAERYEVVTAPGERQIVVLDATTEVTLNGGTRMTFDRKNPRYAALEAGEAYFKVRHDEANPFRLMVGDNIVEDAGTIFNVVHSAGEVRVAVAEGKIVYNPGSAAVSLDAGEALVDPAGAGRIQIETVPTRVVGSWKTGTLVYSAAVMSRVADDIGRTLGVPVEASPAIASRPFSGTIILDGSGNSQLDRLGPALDVRFEKKADGWLMTPRGSQ